MEYFQTKSDTFALPVRNIVSHRPRKFGPSFGDIQMSDTNTRVPKEFKVVFCVSSPSNGRLPQKVNWFSGNTNTGNRTIESAGGYGNFLRSYAMSRDENFVSVLVYAGSFAVAAGHITETSELWMNAESLTGGEAKSSNLDIDGYRYDTQPTCRISRMTQSVDGTAHYIVVCFGFARRGNDWKFAEEILESSVTADGTVTVRWHEHTTTTSVFGTPQVIVDSENWKPGITAGSFGFPTSITRLGAHRTYLSLDTETLVYNHDGTLLGKTTNPFSGKESSVDDSTKLLSELPDGTGIFGFGHKSFGNERFFLGDWKGDDITPARFAGRVGFREPDNFNVVGRLTLMVSNTTEYGTVYAVPKRFTNVPAYYTMELFVGDSSSSSYVLQEKGITDQPAFWYMRPYKKSAWITVDSQKSLRAWGVPKDRGVEVFDIGGGVRIGSIVHTNTPTTRTIVRSSALSNSA